MTEVEFHTGVADPVDFVYRLLRRACRQGSRVLVTAPGPVLMQIDRALWVLDEHDFLPHAAIAQFKLPNQRAAAALTPIWLAGSLQEMLDLADAQLPMGAASERPVAATVNPPSVVVNVGASAPAAATMLAAPLRWIEVVGLDADEAASGRERWRAYKALGLAVVHHPRSGQGA